MEKWKNRLADHSISDFFLTRVSLRALDPNKTLDKDDLLSLFEAARWAPSSYNNQPWRYLYGYKGSEGYDKIFQSLIPFNQLWCKNAQVLCVVISRSFFTHNNKEAFTASLDTGSSMMSLLIEAHQKGLVAHPMEGFSRDQIRSLFRIPEVFKIEAVIAIGYPGDKALLNAEMQVSETPSTRVPLKDFVSENEFDFK